MFLSWEITKKEINFIKAMSKNNIEDEDYDNAEQNQLAQEVLGFLNDDYKPPTEDEEEEGEEEEIVPEVKSDKTPEVKSEEEEEVDVAIDPANADDPDFIEALMKKGEEEGLTEEEEKFLTPIMEKYGLTPTDVDEEPAPITDEPAEEVYTPPAYVKDIEALSDMEIKSVKDYDTAMLAVIEDVKNIREVESALGEAMEQTPWLRTIIEKIVQDRQVSIEDFLSAAEVSLEELLAEPDPNTPEYKEWFRKKIERENADKASLRERQVYSQNLSRSEVALESFIKNKKMDEGLHKKFLNTLNQTIAGIKSGAIDGSGLFDSVYEAITVDSKVSTASEKARIDARNERIQSMRKDMSSKGQRVATPVTPTKATKKAGGDPVVREFRDIFGF